MLLNDLALTGLEEQMLTFLESLRLLGKRFCNVRRFGPYHARFVLPKICLIGSPVMTLLHC